MKKAFTLIELLIVVMIIAILAAIALPNFLEFQIRAKVSRSLSDMRSIATGIEAYAVDNGVYPNQACYTGTPAPIPDCARLITRLKPVTTPIAYLTTLPRDIFNPGVDNMSVEGQDVYTYAEKVSHGGSLKAFSGQYVNPEGPRWSLLSYGPIQNPGDHPTYVSASMYWSTPYDPTNGTVSIGCIHRFGP